MKLDRLGDGVLAIGAIRTLLEHYGEAECLLVISPCAEALMTAEFPRVSRIVLPVAMGGPGQLFSQAGAARQKLRHVACENVICLRHQREDWDELVLAWLAGAHTYLIEGVQLGADFVGRHAFSVPVAERVPAPRAIPDDRVCGELHRHSRLVSHILDRPVTLAEILPRFERLGDVVAQPVSIVVSPFARTSIRDFPASLLLAGLRAIRKYSTTPIALHGDIAQQNRLKHLLQIIKADGLKAVTYAVPTSLDLFAARIRAAELVLTVDTATAHLATALDRPAVVLIGGGHPGEFGPWRRSSRQIWLTERMDCFGCDWQCVHPEPFCITRIPARAVEAAVGQLYAIERQT